MMIEEQMIRKIKEYDAEISEIYNKKDEMETELKDLRCKQLSRSDLLSKYVWIFERVAGGVVQVAIAIEVRRGGGGCGVFQEAEVFSIG